MSMSEKDRIITGLRLKLEERDRIITNLSAELKAERIKYSDLAKKSNEQYEACMQEREGLIAKIKELKCTNN